MVPMAGARLAATALPCDLGDIASTPSASVSLSGKSTAVEVQLSPGGDKLSLRGNLFISVCTIRLHLYVYPGVLSKKVKKKKERIQASHSPAKFSLSPPASRHTSAPLLRSPCGT